MRVCEKDGKEVPWKNIVKGYELDDEHYITLEDEDFENASLETNRSIEIIDFVKTEEINPRLFEKIQVTTARKGLWN